MEITFEKLSKEIEQQFKKHKVTTEDIDEALTWARQIVEKDQSI